MARLISDARRESAQLHAALFQPLLSLIGDADQLLIAPHGPLHALPFHALWDGAAYLIERFEIRYGPSASLLSRRRTARNDAARDSAGARALVVGVADAAAPEIEHEAREIALLLPGAELLCGTAATAARVAAALPHCTVAHLACHGHFSTYEPQSSGLKLADRWLTLRELLQLRLDCALVTLSGCETGQSDIGRGDELVGLMRTLLAAGAGALIVSLWPVHDAATRELMRRFYSGLPYTTVGQATAMTLRAAQREILREREHPAFWAPFITVGEGTAS